MCQSSCTTLPLVGLLAKGAEPEKHLWIRWVSDPDAKMLFWFSACSKKTHQENLVQAHHTNVYSCASLAFPHSTH